MRKRYLTATVFYCAFIFLLSSTAEVQTIELPFLFEGIDKVGHMILYGGLAALISVGLHRSPKTVTPWFQFLFPILFATLYGVTDEIHQIFVPMRQFEVVDIVADMAGATIIQAILCFFWWRGSSTDTGSSG